MRRGPVILTLTLVSAAGGVGTALAMPRGPVTGWQVVGGMLVGVVVGAVSGYAVRSRWAILAAPAIFVVACELSRMGGVGPTVDRPNVDTTFGVLALVLGRGFQGVVQLLPMMLAAAVGAGLARRATGTEPAREGWHRWALWARRAVTGLIAAGLVGLAALLTVPGRTDPIVDDRGAAAGGAVAELARVSLGGHEQTVLIRGRSASDPVLLYLAGGPGQSDLGYTRAYMTELENDLVFAVWDQRGTGTSYSALDPTPTLTLRQAVADTIQLAEYLRGRFKQERIYLFGNSWGSTLGVLAVAQRPDLFHAYIGAGQMVNLRATDQLLYQDVLDHAARTGNSALAERMRGYGPPPYQDVNAYSVVLQYYDAIGPYEKTGYFQTQGPAGIDGTGVSEYGPLDKVNKEKALADMFSVMYPQLQGIDLRTQVTTLAVPVYLIAGDHELRGRSVLAKEWFDGLQAPAKQWIAFQSSGHIPQFEEFPRFRQVLRTVVAEHG